MVKKNIRPYELSLWTLQDGYITTLKTLESSHKGQLETPILSIKNDGTLELNFSVPMYYRENGKLIENPIWYTFQEGTLLVNLRKLKLIFNKGDKSKEEVFEFVINNITESHADSQLKCDVVAEGLAFQELGKVGYKISLNEEDYLNDYAEWSKKTVGENKDFKDEEEKAAAEPINNINYWCEKIFKGSRWDYEIEMDWSAYDGIIVEDYSQKNKEDKDKLNAERETNKKRRLDKIYEDDYVSSWKEDENGNLIPVQIETFTEKRRLMNEEKSNIYNLTQKLAESFGVYCKYKYHYNDDYHIIKKTCIFYNNFLNEQEGQIDINYPYDASKIERKIDSVDVATKLFVIPLEDETAPSGLVTIADASANKTKEDYILNFDYLYSIGSITKEQYDAVYEHEVELFAKNSKLIPLARQISELEKELVEQQAQNKIAQEAQVLAQKEMDQATALKKAITGEKGILEKTKDNPYRAVLLKDPKNPETYYAKISQEGVIYPSDKFKIYYTYIEDKNGVQEKIQTDYTGAYSVDKDANGNVYQVSGLELLDNSYSAVYYFSFEYEPSLYYENIFNTFAKQLADSKIKEEETEKQIEEIELKIKTKKESQKKLLEEKEQIIRDFENLMGPALREGSWQAETYTTLDDKYNGIFNFNDTNSNSSLKYLSCYWDEILFDEEFKNYKEFLNGDKEYYPCINLKAMLSAENEYAEEELKGKSLFEFISPYLSELSIVFGDEKNRRFLAIGSEAQLGFVKESETTTSSIYPVIFITGVLEETSDEKIDLENLMNTGFLARVIPGTEEVNYKPIIQPLMGTNVNDPFKKPFTFLNYENIWLGYTEEQDFSGMETYPIIYPRIKIDSLFLKTSEEELILKTNGRTLKNYYDFSILIRDGEDSYYITPKNNIMMEDGNLNQFFEIYYSIAQDNLALYLDSLEVSKTNAFPQVSYEIEVSALNESFISTAYKQLNRIAHINDFDLKFEHVRGYISELELHLDNFWEDKITIQNYKTKFEDLFSTIVASSEQLKANSFAYNTAGSAFTASGSLRPTVIQNTLNQVDLNYSFNSGNLTIDEVNGIWATSDTGVVAIRGGGIFTATDKNGSGNWIWNTGITPEGINASLLRAGQIDTNLIKVYAGDNLRFQLNADGLFAYENAGGEANLNKYVVHNSDGLFLTEKITREEKDEEGNIVKNTELVNLVEVSWQGFKIRNRNNDEVFWADNNGNLNITGIINANSGNIGGWTITEEGLEHGDNAKIIAKNESSIYDMLYIKGNNDSGSFTVRSDGTLIATNGQFSGTVSANTFISNMSAEEAMNGIRQFRIYGHHGNAFKYTNPNLDGEIVIDVNYLRFQILQNKTDIGAWKIEKMIPESIEEDGSINWSSPEILYTSWDFAEEILPEKEEYKEDIDSFKEEKNSEFLDIEDYQYLTFLAKSGIMTKSETEIVDTVKLKISGINKENLIGEDGIVDFDKSIGKIYSQEILLTNLYINTDQYLSIINPPSYTFINNDRDEYIPETTFTVTLKNLDKNSGFWMVNGIEQDGLTILNGNTDIESDEITRSDSSTILISKEELDSLGRWYINDILIESGDSIEGIEGDFSIIVEEHEDEDGEKYITSTIHIPSSAVQIGDSLNLKFRFKGVLREAFVFKSRNAVDTSTIFIRSSNGTIFKNGVINTELTVDVYEGQTLVNPDDDINAGYLLGYVWKLNGKVLKEDNIEDLTTLKYLNKRTIQIENNSFESIGNYQCDVYATDSEAIDAYLKAIQEEEGVN